MPDHDEGRLKEHNISNCQRGYLVNLSTDCELFTEKRDAFSW